MQVDQVAAPNDLTPDLLTSILTSHYNKSCTFPTELDNARDDDDVSLEWQPLGRGLMSNVQILVVQYASSFHSIDENKELSESKAVRKNIFPNSFLAKFQKPEIPMLDLFSVEGRFYQLAQEEFAAASFPFNLVNAIASGPSWLLLEYIPPEKITSIDVHLGCPPAKFDDLIIRLAKMHARCWISNTSTEHHHDRADITSSLTVSPSSNSIFLSQVLKKHASNLSSTPGVGHSLPPLERQKQFLAAWPAVRERLISSTSCTPSASRGHRDDVLSWEKHLRRMDSIVEWTARSSRIKEIAHRVTERKCTLIHGDYHVGNMLFPVTQHADPESNHDAASMPWLVDWSMAGVGNPLVDLVFFLVVGANGIPINEGMTETEANDITSHIVGRVISQYYRALNEDATTRYDATTKNASLTMKTSSLLPWEIFLSMFRQCLLNQFIILVCYDSLCRNMANSFPDGMAKVYNDHFDRVNARCVRMLLSDYGWVDNILD